MAKTYDFNSPVGKVRFFASEKDPAATDYTDEEIQGMLDEAEQDIYLATALLWEAKASLASGAAVKETVGGVTIDPSSTAQYALKMAEHFRDKAGSEPCADVAEYGGTDFQRREILLDEGREW